MTGTPEQSVTLISADRVIDGTGREPLARAAVAVRGDRIVAVEAIEELAARFPGAARLDFPGGTIMPGMVDSHVHVTFSASAVPFEDIQNDGDVTVSASPNDLRSCLIQLTDSGQEKLHSLTSFGLERFSKFVADWDAEEVRTFTHLLRKFEQSKAAVAQREGAQGKPRWRNQE